MNQTTIAGHLGADPETRFTSSGHKVTTLRVAARVRRGGKEETIWWRVSVWGEQFDKMMPHFKKGSSIIVVGEMNKPEIFTDREGRSQVSMSMTALNLMFSPFGRTDPSGGESAATSTTSTESTCAMAHEGFSYGLGSQGGQGKGGSSLGEEEVPF